MKKNIEFMLSYNLFAQANKPIRQKSDIIKLLLASVQELMFEGSHNDHNLGSCEVIIGKMSRINYTLKNESGQIYKKFSFSFPFFVEEQTNPDKLSHWSIKDSNGLEVNSQLISVLINLLEDNWFDDDMDLSNEALMFYEHILEAVKTIDTALFTDTIIWHMIRRLFLFEPGYLRYDYDDDESRCDPVSHPLHHLDVFFSSNATFKIGIFEEIISEGEWGSNGFINLLDLETPCYYLSNNKQE